jgi:hypothetical protein
MPATESSLNDLTGVTTWSAAYDYFHDRYQEYYATGLDEALRKRGVALTCNHLQRMPKLLRGLRRLRSSSRFEGVMSKGVGRMVDWTAGVAAGRRTAPSGVFHPLAGQYEFAFAHGDPVRLVVDAQDGGDLADPGLLKWADVYAKSNFRSDSSYPEHVVPICNGNPLIIPHRQFLASQRNAGCEYDICFIVRVWGGQDEEAGIEHNLRLLEAVNKCKCRKYLLAYLVAGDIGKQEARLQAQGIPTTRTFIPLRELWKYSAASRINILRLGMHNCIPWRFMDMLAMGACVALDQAPQTEWAPPLIRDEHYRVLGAATDPKRPFATEAQYEQIPELLHGFLNDPDRIQHVRRTTADYFDRYSCPTAIGRYILERVAKVRGDRSAPGGKFGH